MNALLAFFLAIFFCVESASAQADKKQLPVTFGFVQQKSWRTRTNDQGQVTRDVKLCPSNVESTDCKWQRLQLEIANQMQLLKFCYAFSVFGKVEVDCNNGSISPINILPHLEKLFVNDPPSPERRRK